MGIKNNACTSILVPFKGRFLYFVPGNVSDRNGLMVGDETRDVQLGQYVVPEDIVL